MRHRDDRGWFTETYARDRFAAVGVRETFPQENQSWSEKAGTVRGIHFQRPPSAQAKLISCLRGQILDCIVDLRIGSPSFGRSLTVELTEAGEQLFVPVGFGHGFLTVLPDTLISYKVSHIYDPSADDGIAWNDPALGIDWPLPVGGPTVSAKDASLKRLADLESPFGYDGQPFEILRV